jgi:hypothetical protein
MKQINSLLTVKFFNVVQKYPIDSRFCSISIRDMVSNRRSKYKIKSIRFSRMKFFFFTNKICF